ncbi:MULTISPECIES: hypothetical protein [unclassified Streptomyces]|uniref:hypothetical protein n=1 Tax=unclassified Streptomyces TaxID=2593676 RepID=UPI00381B5C4A
MGLLDKIDNAMAGAIAGRGAQREAREFAATVEPGRTYYSVLDCHFAWGKGRLLQEWTFSGRSLISGQPRCGHLTAAGVWLSYGPIHAVRPAGIKTFAEYAASSVSGPDPEEAVQRAVPAGV